MNPISSSSAPPGCDNDDYDECMCDYIVASNSLNTCRLHTTWSSPLFSMPPKDWSKIEREIVAEEEAEKKANLKDDAALKDFFEKIYSNATDDQRRAMVKSFQTSSGTVLSTNWDEVAKADYAGSDRPDPPAGQEWKTKK